MLALGGCGTDLAFIAPLFTAIGELGRFIVGVPVRPTVVPARFTVGRAKLPAGGVIRARDAPSTADLLGLAATERIDVIRLIWLGETRKALRPTCCPLTSVFRETAVNPFGECMLA
jgi:hypothetical protein